MTADRLLAEVISPAWADFSYMVQTNRGKKNYLNVDATKNGGANEIFVWVITNFGKNIYLNIHTTKNGEKIKYFSDNN